MCRRSLSDCRAYVGMNGIKSCMLNLIIVLVAPVSITLLINSRPTITLATMDDLSTRSSGYSGRTGNIVAELNESSDSDRNDENSYASSEDEQAGRSNSNFFSSKDSTNRMRIAIILTVRILVRDYYMSGNMAKHLVYSARIHRLLVGGTAVVTALAVFTLDALYVTSIINKCHNSYQKRLKELQQIYYVSMQYNDDKSGTYRNVGTTGPPILLIAKANTRQYSAHTSGSLLSELPYLLTFGGEPKCLSSKIGTLDHKIFEQEHFNMERLFM
uniref:Uncharacterized protein n=1 Tax=Glossina pallidipes TaxID=7398 RepID=A0A1A9ZCM8_GLOPL